MKNKTAVHANDCGFVFHPVAMHRLDGNITCYTNAAYNRSFNNTPVNATNTATTPSYSTPAYYTYTWSVPGSNGVTANPAISITTGNTAETVSGTVTAKIPTACASLASAATTIMVEGCQLLPL